MAKIKKYTTKTGKIRYEFQVYAGVDSLTGRQKTTRRRGFKTRKEASIVLSRLELEIEKRGLQEAERRFFGDVCAEWMEQYRLTVRESTLEKTQRIINIHVLPAFGDMLVDQITPNVCQKVVNKWFLEAKSFKKWLNYASMIFDYALRAEYVDRNPCTLVIMPRVQEQAGEKLENFWTRDELNTFFDYMTPKRDVEQFTMFRLLAYSGIRKGELLALTWKDIDFEGNTLRVNKTLTQGLGGKLIVQPPKSRAGRRTIDLDDSTMRYLRQWKGVQRETFLGMGFNTNNTSQLVFASNRNHFRSMNTPTKWLNKAIKATGLKHISIHGFRHTHASLLYQSGVGLKETQQRLGHSRADSSVTLDVYTHTTEQQNVAALQRFEDYVEAK